MKVAVLGAGPVGTAMAALAAACGHEASLWSPRGGGTRRLGGTARLEGVVEGRFPLRVAADAARAMEGASCILACIPGHALPGILRRVVPLLTGEPAFLLCPPGAPSALLLRRLALARGLRPRIGVMPVPPLAARRAAEGVEVVAMRRRWWLAGLDARNAPPLARLAGEAFGLEEETRLLATRLGRWPPPLAETAEGGALAAAAPAPEEVGTGLAFLEAMGRAAGLAMPLTAAALRVLEAASGQALAPHPALDGLSPGEREAAFG